MTDKRPWVLVSEGLDGESRGTIAVLRALDLGGYRAAATVSGSLSLAAASRFCMRAVRVPIASDPGYAAAIRDELSAGNYLTVLSTSDAALLALGAPVRHLLDKKLCSERAMSVGIPVAPTQMFASSAEALDAGADLPYPIVVKPALKRYAATRVENRDGLARAMPDDGPVLVQPFLDGGFRAVSGLVSGGRLLGAVHMRYERIWPRPCGTVASAVTIRPDDDIERSLIALLDGYEGIFHAEFLGPYLQDLNPRAHGTLPLAIASGVNLVARYCDVLRGRNVQTQRGTPGSFFRWIEGDYRSIMFSLRAGEIGLRSAAAALSPKRHTVHSYESFSDMGPLFARVRFAGRRLRRGAQPSPPLAGITEGS